MDKLKPYTGAGFLPCTVVFAEKILCAMKKSGPVNSLARELILRCLAFQPILTHEGTQKV